MTIEATITHLLGVGYSRAGLMQYLHDLRSSARMSCTDDERAVTIAAIERILGISTPAAAPVAKPVKGRGKQTRLSYQ